MYYCIGIAAYTSGVSFGDSEVSRKLPGNYGFKLLW